MWRGVAFLWCSDRDPPTYRGFRVAGDDPASSRLPEDLPPEEIINSAIEILDQHMSVPLADLVRESARLLGYRRVGKIVRERLEAAIRLSVDRGQTELKGQMVVRKGAPD